MLLCFAATPAFFGGHYNGVRAGLLGGLIATLTFLAAWFYMVAKDDRAKALLEKKLRKDADKLYRKLVIDYNREQGATGAKDALISALQDRVGNLNREYHEATSRKPRATTSADVRRLTGEG